MKSYQSFSFLGDSQVGTELAPPFAPELQTLNQYARSATAFRFGVMWNPARNYAFTDSVFAEFIKNLRENSDLADFEYAPGNTNLSLSIKQRSVLLSVLHRNSKLRTLYFHVTAGDDLRDLATCVNHNPQLESLILKGSVDTASFARFTECLDVQLFYLRNLDLSENPVAGKSIAALIVKIPPTPEMTLNLSRCGLQDEGALWVLEALDSKDCFGVMRLDLSGNKLSDKVCNTLVELIRKRKFSDLNLADTRLTESGKQQLRIAVQDSGMQIHVNFGAADSQLMANFREDFLRLQRPTIETIELYNEEISGVLLSHLLAYFHERQQPLKCISFKLCSVSQESYPLLAMLLLKIPTSSIIFTRIKLDCNALMDALTNSHMMNPHVRQCDLIESGWNNHDDFRVFHAVFPNLPQIRLTMEESITVKTIQQISGDHERQLLQSTRQEQVMVGGVVGDPNESYQVDEDQFSRYLRALQSQASFFEVFHCTRVHAKNNVLFSQSQVSRIFSACRETPKIHTLILHKLDLTGIMREVAAFLNQCHQLKKLSLTYCVIPTEDFFEFIALLNHNFPHLVEIELYGTVLTGLSVSSFLQKIPTRPKLHLNLQACQLGDEGLTFVLDTLAKKHYYGRMWLNVAKNGLTDNSVPGLASRLSTNAFLLVGLFGNRFSDRGYAKLENAIDRAPSNMHSYLISGREEYLSPNAATRPYLGLTTKSLRMTEEQIAADMLALHSAYHVSNQTRLTVIDFQSCTIGDDAYPALANLLEHFPCPVIRFNQTGLSPAGFRLLFEKFMHTEKTYPTLQELYFTNCDLQDDSVRFLNECRVIFPNLRILKVSGNPLSIQVFEEVAQWKPRRSRLNRGWLTIFRGEETGIPMQEITPEALEYKGYQ